MKSNNEMDLKLLFNGIIFCGKEEISLKIILIKEDIFYITRNLERPYRVDLNRLIKLFSGCEARGYLIHETKDKQELEYDEMFCKEVLCLEFKEPIIVYQNAKLEKLVLFKDCLEKYIEDELENVKP